MSDVKYTSIVQTQLNSFRSIKRSNSIASYMFLDFIDFFRKGFTIILFTQIENLKSVSLIYFRISVIMRVFKSRTFRTNDSELYKKVLIVILGCTLYMTLWTLIDPDTPSKPQEQGSVLCKLQPWNFVAIAGKLLGHVNGRGIH